MPNGYGQFGFTRSTPALAHRISWGLAYGPIPEGKHVLHHCDNRACVNPLHLFLGTNSDNIADRVAKGRSAKGDAHWSHRMPHRKARGEAAGNVKLTEKDVAAIRSMLSAGVFQRVIAAQYGISRATVSKIKGGKLWRHSLTTA